MMRYIPITDADRTEMLETIGVKDVGELFSDIPEHLLLKRQLDHLPDAQTEREVKSALQTLADMNADPRRSASFLGGGAYEHFIPSLVHQIQLLPGFLKPYTPYHGEPSQGILQVLFEYQTLIAQLTGMDVANASLYEGGTALAEAVFMARRIKRPRKTSAEDADVETRVLVSRGVHPMYRDTLSTYTAATNPRISPHALPVHESGRTNFLKHERLPFPREHIAAVVVQYPNFFGVVEDLAEARAYADAAGALLIVVVAEPVALGLLEPPGTFGADIVVGEGQSLGCPLGFGGPYLGLFAAKSDYLLEMPGRLIGKTKEKHGEKDGYIVTLATREQHIKREKATSNICTNEALLCVGSAVWMSLYGKYGFRELAEQNFAKAEYAKSQFSRLGDFSIRFNGCTFNEFVVRSHVFPVPKLLKQLAAKNIFGGIHLGRWYEQFNDSFLVCVTEMCTKESIDRLVDAITEITRGYFHLPLAYQGKRVEKTCVTPPLPVKRTAKARTGTPSAGLAFLEPLIFERSSRGKRGIDMPKLDVPEPRPIYELLPASFLRTDIEGFPEVSEPEVAKHFVRLSNLNLSIETATLYPLGSCTMKDNPRFHEDIARLPQFAGLHPHMPTEHAQGALTVLWHLQELLAEISGMHAVTLLPAAGAHGEFTGLLVIKKALRERREKRAKILIPDSAHGTNPASAALCGLTPITVKSGPDGRVSADAVAKLMDETCAGIMITNPNTLGLFETEIDKIAEIVHSKGGYVYCDGANLNAIVGVARPGDMGIDVLQMNLHKTFSTPHGGGGPGSGPVGVTRELESYLPTPRIEYDDDGMLGVVYNKPDSIGAVRTFYGNFLVCLRAYAYLLSYGKDIGQIAETAVLSANYILAKLRGAYDAPINPRGAPCKHECVLSDTFQRTHGVSTKDIAKRLMDYGFHPPTVYFPLIVKNALMIEPTETASKDELDAFIDAMLAIAREAQTDPKLVLNAPHLTPVRRLNESVGLTEQVLRWTPSE